MADESKSDLKRIAMSKEDELFFMIKHGYIPKFRIEKHVNELDGVASLEYILTNIPIPGDTDND